MKIREVIQVMEQHHTHFDSSRPTCDGVITGNVENECTGVALSCSPSVEVIRKAAQLGCNLLIAHEPTFYDGMDKTDWLENNPVFQGKCEWIQKTGMTIYRNHDHLHSDQPDGIFDGVTQLLGWKPYLTTDGYMPVSCFQIPKTTLGQVIQKFCQVAHIDGLRFVGDPQMEVERVGFSMHFFGEPRDQTMIQLIQKHDVQVLITGETVDWTIVAYMQDAQALGQKRALVTPGHYNWEEPGMKYVAGWLSKALEGRVPVTFVQSGNQYRWANREQKEE